MQARCSPLRRDPNAPCAAGTNGLGAATAKMLASRHPAKIYITGRNQAAAQQTIDSIKSSTDSATEVEWIRCDHADLATVKEAADRILAKESRLDVLMANAGVMALPPGLVSYPPSPFPPYCLSDPSRTRVLRSVCRRWTQVELCP